MAPHRISYIQSYYPHPPDQLQDAITFTRWEFRVPSSVANGFTPKWWWKGKGKCPPNPPKKIRVFRYYNIYIHCFAQNWCIDMMIPQRKLNEDISVAYMQGLCVCVLFALLFCMYCLCSSFLYQTNVIEMIVSRFGISKNVCKKKRSSPKTTAPNSRNGAPNLSGDHRICQWMAVDIDFIGIELPSSVCSEELKQVCFCSEWASGWWNLKWAMKESWLFRVYRGWHPTQACGDCNK